MVPKSFTARVLELQHESKTWQLKAVDKQQLDMAKMGRFWKGQWSCQYGQ